MKKIIFYIITVFVLISTSSCQDVVELDLKTAQERLVIEAMIYWEQGTLGNNQSIKLTKTSSYYNNQIVTATGATVTVTNTNTLENFVFIEANDLYSTANFVPIIGDSYRLTIIYNGETYTAEETLFESPVIESITQTTGTEDEDSKVTVSFQDIENQEDYYRIRFKQYRPSTDENIDSEDFVYDSKFEANNLLSDYYESEEIEVGDEFTISVLKISKQFYTFINILEAQSGGAFGPFASPPVNVKGNCINSTNEGHYPYGYFDVYQADKEVYTFQ